MRTVTLSLAVMLAAAGPVEAGAKLVLTDGRVLLGLELRRDAGLYLLEQESGQVVPIPLAAVSRVDLGTPTSGDESGEVLPTEDVQPEQRTDPLSGISYGREARRLAGPEVEEAAVFQSEPAQLEGVPVIVPSTADQLAALGPQAGFPRGVVEPNYTLETDWDFSSPHLNNSWSTVRWTPPAIDPAFVPRSEWDSDPRTGNSWAPSTWSDGIFDSVWVPGSAWHMAR